MNTTILNNLPEQKEQKKQTKKLLTIIVVIVLLVLLLTFLITVNVAAEWNDADSKQIADYEYQINENRKAKEKCFDNLTWQETQDYLKWFTKPCVEWDEQIMALRAKADELKHKSYEGLN